MATAENGLDAAWSGWSQAAMGLLFPRGLSVGQRFSFGQTTLVADFANADPQIANAEVFRIADAVPAASANFMPFANLSEAYGFFLGRIDSPDLAAARQQLAEANSPTSTDFNMPARVGLQAPAGSTAVTIGGDPFETPSTLRQTFLPAYLLDSGFRTRYQEWQRASVAGQTRAGGVIAFTARLGADVGPASSMLESATATAAGPVANGAFAASRAAKPPAFFRVVARKPMPARSLTDAGASNEAVSDPPRPAALAAAPPEHSVPARLAASASPTEFSMAVAFTGLGTFMVGPARWFSDTVIRLFASRLSPADDALFFGSSGVLARRIYQVVIAFEPTVTLRFADGGAFRNAKDMLSQPGGDAVGIGPINFDARLVASGGDGAPTYSEQDQTITIGSAPSTLPILLGVVSTSFFPGR